MDNRYKFRFYDNDKKIMIDEDTDSAMLINEYGKDEWWCCFEAIFPTILNYFDSNEYEKKDFVIMQCTGLKDKNGKLIYEGDIVKFAFHEFAEEKAWEKAVIVWGDKYKYPAFDLDKCEFECNGLSYIFNEGWVIEVIGNIYENPELLEGR